MAAAGPPPAEVMAHFYELVGEEAENAGLTLGDLELPANWAEVSDRARRRLIAEAFAGEPRAVATIEAMIEFQAFEDLVAQVEEPDDRGERDGRQP